jgi:hypothetical protein
VTPADLLHALKQALDADDLDPALVDDLADRATALAHARACTPDQARALHDHLGALIAKVQAHMAVVERELTQSQSRVRAVRGYGAKVGIKAVTRGQRVMRRV